jgi:hypothetical protein
VQVVLGRNETQNKLENIESEKKRRDGTSRQEGLRGERRYTDLTSRLRESRFFLDLEVEHHGGSLGKREESERLGTALRQF